MSIRAVFIICVMVANAAWSGEVSDRHNGGHGWGRPRPSDPGNDAVLQICRNSANTFLCIRTAKKCLFKLPNQQPASCSCIGSLTDVSSIYATWVQTHRRGHDICTEENRHHSNGHFGGRETSFTDYLRDVNATLSASLECCIGEFQGLYFANGTANTSVWKQSASSISNATVLTAVNTAIDGCASSVTTCSPRNFMACVVGGCYNSIQI